MPLDPQIFSVEELTSEVVGAVLEQPIARVAVSKKIARISVFFISLI